MKMVSMSLEEYESDLQKKFLAGYRKSLLDLADIIVSSESTADLSQTMMNDFHVDAGLHCFQVDKLMAALKKVGSLNEQS
jgi:hypothetical protein